MWGSASKMYEGWSPGEWMIEWSSARARPAADTTATKLTRTAVAATGVQARAMAPSYTGRAARASVCGRRRRGGRDDAGDGARVLRKDRPVHPEVAPGSQPAPAKEQAAAGRRHVLIEHHVVGQDVRQGERPPG